jgi:hypothetical protein
MNLEVLGDTNFEANGIKIGDVAGEIGDKLIHIGPFELESKKVIIDFGLVCDGLGLIVSFQLEPHGSRFVSSLIIFEFW